MLRTIQNLSTNPPLNLPDPRSGFERHLSFLNNLGLSTQLVAVLQSGEHSSKPMGGWQGIASLTCLGENNQLYDIDVRYAWGSEIFKQNLFDNGGSEATLLHQRLKKELTRHKLIVYLCEASTGLQVSQKSQQVPERFAIGRYWQTIYHFYLLLPLDHPFVLPPMRSNTTQFGDYGTARSLSTEKPTFINEANNNKISTLLFLPPHPLRQGEGGLRTQGRFKKLDKNQEFVSVITVVFNGEKYLEQTIQSVINQYADLEYIIIDGGSSDGTLDIIRKYENQIDYWVSEPDGGIYDAMNKGTIAALGTHTVHINADDLLLQPNSLPMQLAPVNYMHGGLYLLEEGRIVKQLPLQPHANFDMSLIYMLVNHQSFIGTKNVNSLFDINYRLVADRIVVARKIEFEDFEIKPTLIMSLRREGGASSGSNYRILKEIKKALGKTKSFKVRLNYIRIWVCYMIGPVVKATGWSKIKRIILGLE